MTAAEAAQRRAVDRAETRARIRFMDVAIDGGIWLANQGEPFTSGDLRDAIARNYPGVEAPDDRALGAVMRKLAKARVIEPTGRYVPSGRASNHNRPMREWRGRKYP